VLSATSSFSYLSDRRDAASELVSRAQWSSASEAQRESGNAPLQCRKDDLRPLGDGLDRRETRANLSAQEDVEDLSDVLPGLVR
jgi:hypothetical protein